LGESVARMNTYTRLGYMKIEESARRARHEWWRATYRHAFYRRLIGTCLACVLTSIVVWVLIVLAHTPKDYQP